MGTRGPIPKRSDQRRRRNAAGTPDQAAGADDVVMPEPDESWHPVARMWYVSLGQSGQSEFYEPSDWAYAFLIAESISRDLEEQVVGVVQQGPNAGEIVKSVIPLKGASLSAYAKAFSVLLVSEGDRRRALMELQRGGKENPNADRAEATVTQLHALLGGKSG